MRTKVLVPLGAFLVSLAAYVATLAPGVAGGDAGEMQFVPHVLGIAHWTGYPLYTMFGKLWEILIPFGSIAYRLNLLSAVASAAAVALTCMAGYRLTGSWIGGVFAALVLASSPLFWNWSIVAGVRSPTVFFASLNLTIALDWGYAVRRANHHARRFLLALAVAYGLSLAHHRTTIFLLPALVVYILVNQLLRQGRENAATGTSPEAISTVRSPFSWGRHWPEWLLALVIALTIPVVVYLYIPLRSAMHPPYAVIEAHHLRGFFSLVFAPGLAGGVATPLTVADLPPRTLDAIRQFGREFTWPLVTLGCLGAVACLKQRTREALLLLIPFLLFIAFTINYNLGNSDLNVVYLLPAYLIFSLLTGYGLSVLANLVATRSSGRRSSFAFHMLLPTVALVAVAAAYVVLYQARPTWQGIQALNAAPLDAYRLTLRGPQAARLVENSLPSLPNGAVLIGDWEQLTPFWYSELVERRIADLEFHYPMEPDVLMWVTQARQLNKPIFLARHSDQVIGQRYLSSRGPLVELRSSPAMDLPAGTIRQAAVFGNEVQLLGYRYWGLQGPTMCRNSVLSLELYWTAQRQLSVDYSVSVRLVDGQGRVVGSVDNVHPVLSMYPTRLWQPGEVVGDYYELSLPASLSAGTYHVEIIVYARDSGGFRNLLVQQGEQTADRLALPDFSVR